MWTSKELRRTKENKIQNVIAILKLDICLSQVVTVLSVTSLKVVSDRHCESVMCRQLFLLSTSYIAIHKIIYSFSEH